MSGHSVADLVALLSAATGPARENIWVDVVNRLAPRTVLELGVWKGDFAQRLLAGCPGIERYYMLDPWQHLDRWNKPLNVDQTTFDAVYSEAMAKTDFAKERRVVLRGTTTGVIDQIPDASLDFAYVDGDHTLRGIAIDLMRTYPKMKPGGVLAGDDLTPSIWQHADNFEPSLVFPFAIHFAEAQGVPIVALPHYQFAIVKPDGPGSRFELIDPTGSYPDWSLRAQVVQRPGA